MTYSVIFLGTYNAGLPGNMLEGQGKSEIRDFLEKVREENLCPCNFLTSIKKSFSRRSVCRIVYDNQFYI